VLDASFGLGRGFTHYEDQSTSLMTSFMRTAFGEALLKATALPDRFGTHENFGRKSAEAVSGEFLRWLAARDTTRPYFAFLNYFDAHAPYLPPEPFARRFRPVRPRGDLESRALDAWSPAEISELADAHDGAIAYLDDQIGRLVDELDRRGGLANTIVVITADHGEQLGEHGLLDHANSLYLPLLHVPLIIVAPRGVPPGMRRPESVSLRDLAATLLDLTGSGTSGFPGESLTTYWTGSAAENRGDSLVLSEVDRALEDPSWYPAAKGPMKSLISGRLHYIRNFGDGREELYDVAADPGERDDLGTSEPAVLADFRQRLDAMVRAAQAARGGAR
jgi:arylsulfatase A-like enzyme